MKVIRRVLVDAFVGGVIVLLPLYLSIWLLYKAGAALFAMVGPVSTHLPAWIPFPPLVTLLALVLACVLLGLVLRVSAGRAIRDALERWLLQRLPGYALFRSMTQRFTGQGASKEWKPALAEIDDGLVPVFIVEEVDAERVTVFVPSVPTPLAGNVRVLPAAKVHAVDIPLTQAVKAISHWGSGTRELVAKMKPGPAPTSGHASGPA